MDSNEIVPGSFEDRDITRFEVEPFPNLEDAVQEVLSELDYEGFTPYQIEIGLLASREVTYKVRVKEQEETLSGVVYLGGGS